MRKKENLFKKALKRRVYKAQKFLCADCQKALPLEPHHILPVSIGGQTIRENLVGLCRVCHATRHGEKV